MTNHKFERLLAGQSAESIGAELGIVSSRQFLGYDMFAVKTSDAPPRWAINGAPFRPFNGRRPTVRLLGTVEATWSSAYGLLALKVYAADGERLEDPDGFRIDNTARSYGAALCWIWIRWEIQS